MFRARSRGEYPTQTNIQTRGSNDARSARHRLTTTQHAVSYAGPKYWNSFPQNLRSINRYMIANALREGEENVKEL